ncbi:peroxisome biogenesis factor 2 isoform X2 [Pieris napi]|uniref:peroxisome biogenesis factor 2 isoform X2 n=1 Tax=Pieris napi TaxID=78633 RepID=UPI001FB9E336|nr:peroxisome biogenesis factor 2 isoform X2 [Pieris napi]
MSLTFIPRVTQLDSLQLDEELEELFKNLLFQATKYLEELIGTSLSLVNMFGLRQKLSKILKYVWWRNYARPSNKTSQATMNVNTVCAVCSEKPTLPHVMGCSHIFCYYCLQANKMADTDFTCPKCYYNGKSVTKFVVV